MTKILKYIAAETQGECFKSFKYCYDTLTTPTIEYESGEQNFINLKEYAEDVHDPKPRDLTGRARICLNTPPLFSFFLDGSRRVYKVDDIQYDKQVFPIISGQISVACCQRIVYDDFHFDSFHHVIEEAYPVVCLPIRANGEGIDNEVFFGNLRNKLNQLPELISAGIELRKVLYYPTKLNFGETYENKGIARIQDEMIDCEKRIVSSLVGRHLLNQDSYLIKDGSIQYKPMKTGDFRELSKIRNNYRYVIGVSKKFNPNFMRDVKDQSSAGQIARLPLYHRTPAFLWKPGDQWGNVNFAVWYVRIRDLSKSESPYAGIIKVEKMLMTGHENENGLYSEEIDTISAHLINERNPVCYGTDARWANHLYPVYMTEQYCKSRFHSDYFFLNLF